MTLMDLAATKTAQKATALCTLPSADIMAVTYSRYSKFGSDTFCSREFAKVVRDAGLMDAKFNISPPNRVDFVYTYACVHGPGGHRGNRRMSFAQFAYAVKGVAHETARPLSEVVLAFSSAEPYAERPVSRRIDAWAPVSSPRPSLGMTPALNMKPALPKSKWTSTRPIRCAWGGPTTAYAETLGRASVEAYRDGGLQGGANLHPRTFGDSRHVRDVPGPGDRTGVLIEQHRSM